MISICPFKLNDQARVRAPLFRKDPLLGRGIAQFRHHYRPFQCILLNGDPGRGRRTVGDVPGGSDGGARRALWADEEEEDQAYRDHGADGDAPCHLPVGHGGVARIRETGSVAKRSYGRYT